MPDRRMTEEEAGQLANQICVELEHRVPWYQLGLMTDAEVKIMIPHVLPQLKDLIIGVIRNHFGIEPG